MFELPFGVWLVTVSVTLTFVDVVNDDGAAPTLHCFTGAALAAPPNASDAAASRNTAQLRMQSIALPFLFDVRCLTAMAKRRLVGIVAIETQSRATRYSRFAFLTRSFRRSFPCPNAEYSYVITRVTVPNGGRVPELSRTTAVSRGTGRGCERKGMTSKRIMVSPGRVAVPPGASAGDSTNDAFATFAAAQQTMTRVAQLPP